VARRTSPPPIPKSHAGMAPLPGTPAPQAAVAPRPKPFAETNPFKGDAPAAPAAPKKPLPWSVIAAVVGAGLGLVALLITKM
jgi:hypothetical protein